MKKKIIGYTFGMFDLVHYGHIHLLEKISNRVDVLIVGVLDNDSAKRVYGSVLSDISERINVISKLEFVDQTMIQTEISPYKTLSELKLENSNSDIQFFHGNSWIIYSFKADLNEIDVKSVKLEYSSNFSNSNILKTLSKNDLFEGRTSFLGSKGETLISLRGLLKKSKIEPLFILSRGEYKKLAEGTLMDKIGTLEASKLVIRSSSKSEDQNNESNAGKYESILNVDINHIEIRSAIEMVFASYDDINDSDHLIIQRMTTNSDTSGVVFTRELNTNNPYYIINYSKGNDTSTITSGKDGSTDLIYRFAIIPDRWRTLIDAVKEIEDIFESKPLDIEFSLQNGVAIIHQVRPMVFSSRTDISYDSIIRLHLTMIEKYNEISDKGSWILSDMAFWNPAEIIGINPKPLAYSLYSKIITDKSWNTGISEIGYSKVDNILMHQLGNKPLIDVISSFEALTPATIGIEIRNKLIDYYIDKISNEPYLHDKIEFNLVFNCLNFNSMEMLANLPIDILSDPEKEALYCSLKKFTFTIINDFDKWVSIDDEIKNEILNDLDSLEIEYKNSDVFYLSHLILDFVDKIKNSIAVAFSREARYAFIAKNIVDSMEGKNDISSTELSDFYESLRSITRDYRAYSNKVKTNEISYDDFLNFYGHLRSGTYDITTMPYSELDRVSVISDNQTPFVYSNLEEATVSDKVINSLITNISILFGGIDENKVRNFIYDAIPRREEFKFYYSKALSFVIEMIAFLGEKLSFNREEMQYLSLDDISMFNRFNSNIEFRSYLNMILNGRRDIYKQNLYILVPDIVFSENDLSFFSLLNSKPNFVNREVVSGNVAHLNSMSNLNIDNKIIVIENADPGFDWIFNHNIIGLITKYGGVASHMAIRCSELRIPAAIGVGLKLFNTIKDDSIVTIDGLNQRLEVK